ncbi:MAG: cytochrome c oxidase subunit 4 [Chloroflexi bacterium]|jgi:cytochrome c oxidase subunit 4|nr:MAG: cytochrome c oxidase subunit 4 [Chloroflexota bacterium]
MAQDRYRSLRKGIRVKREVVARPRLQAHPTPTTYVAIAIILGLITAVEFGAIYLNINKNVIIPIFGAMSAVKFAVVAMFYMHLKFDNRIFSALFVGGVLLAGIIILTLISLFAVFFAA